MLNQIVKRHSRKGITFEADPRHAEIISRGTGAEKLKTISTPAAKETGRETEKEKRQVLKENRLSGNLGGNGDTLSADDWHRTGWTSRLPQRKQRGE